MNDHDFHAACEEAALAAFGDSTFPDAAFIIEVGATKDEKTGRTLQKYRHLPHHKKGATSGTDNASVDLPHLRNALARVNQVTPVQEEAKVFRARALRHLRAHANQLLKTEE